MDRGFSSLYHVLSCPFQRQERFAERPALLELERFVSCCPPAEGILKAPVPACPLSTPAGKCLQAWLAGGGG